MTDRIYCVSSALSLGCTFLDWSLLYLSGQQKFFNVKKSAYIDITKNPLLTQTLLSNSHGHQKNHPSGQSKALQFALILEENHDGHNTASMYPFPLHLDECCLASGIDLEDLSVPDKLKIATDYQKQDYLDMLEELSDRLGIPTIYVWHDQTHQSYYWGSRSADRKLVSPEKPQSVQDLQQEHQDLFFRSSQRRWKDLGMTDVWDQRERLALDMRPFDQHWSKDLIPDVNTLIYCQDLWFDTESTVVSVINELDLKIDTNRLSSWRSIASDWSRMHQKIMQFPNQLLDIVDCIINNRDCHLDNLTLYQEAIIQHCLIYQHGLNLKTWQLTKFPTNTRDLHSLLETNIHPI